MLVFGKAESREQLSKSFGTAQPISSGLEDAPLGA